MREQWQSITVGAQSMPTFVVLPDGVGPNPGVVVACHAGGVDDFVQETSRRVAQEGYVALAPDLFHRQPIDDRSGARLRDMEIIDDMNASIAHLGGLDAVGQGVGVMGFCLGGRVAYMMSGVNPTLKVAVSYYGGFTLSNRAGDPPAIDRLASAYCPVLGFFGEDDQNPSPEDMRAIDEQLTRHGKPHELHSFPGAAHSFMDFTNPQSYRPEAAAASWEITVEFLRRYLQSVASPS